MATGAWGKAQDLLREAADIIEARSAGRDETGRPDTVALAALAEGMTPQQVLAAMIGLKRARLSRGGDRDSAVDLLAYEARRLAGAVAEPQTHHAEEAPMPPHDSGIGQALAERQHDAIEAGNSLNTADTTGPGEV